MTWDGEVQQIEGTKTNNDLYPSLYPSEVFKLFTISMYDFYNNNYHVHLFIGCAAQLVRS